MHRLALNTKAQSLTSHCEERSDEAISSCRIKSFFIWAFITFALLIPQAAQAAPGISLNLGEDSRGVAVGVQLLILLTILSIAPSILLMTTSFVRFIIVFSMLRTAMGIGQLPPTQVLIGLSLILTFMVMQPTFDRINTEALQPFMNQQIDEKAFFEKSFSPLREFMLKQTGETELKLAIQTAEIEQPKEINEVPNHLVVMAFMLSELKKSFQIGFMLFLPFLIIDMIVASALVSVGLMFLPPTTVALPFKVILFVLIDGWAILSQGLVQGFVR